MTNSQHLPNQELNQKPKAEAKIEATTKVTAETAPKKDYRFSNSKTKKIAITAILIALSFVMPYFMPTITLPFTTFTLFSHVPVIIAMFVSPFTAIMGCIGTTLAFFLKTSPIVALRAASHILFALPGSLAINKGLFTKGFSIFLGGALLGVIHGAAEIIVVAIFLGVTDVSFTLYYIMIEVGLITLGHHCVDYIFSLVVYKSCSRANLLQNKFLFAFKKNLNNS
ncbi:MAG TPA: hypothetical protein GX745_02820 [Clostridiales bacterium]|nr:hypothetical protein [Clostridiales bacterium]